MNDKSKNQNPRKKEWRQLVHMRIMLFASGTKKRDNTLFIIRC